MNLFERLSVSRAIAVIDGPLRADDAARVRALERVEQAGSKAVPRLIEALENSRNTADLIDLLARVLTTEALPYVTKALSDGAPEVADAVLAVLAKPGRWDANKLLPLFLDPDCRYKTVLAHTLAQHGSRIKAPALLALLDDLLPEDRAPVAWLLGQLAGEAMAPRLAERLLAGDEVACDLAVRRALIGALGRLGSKQGRSAMIDLLDSDPRPEVRLALLDALVAGDEPPIEAICRRLRDGDIRVQSRAQDILSGLPSPAVVHRVAELLADDAVETRRAAVEILNRKGDESALPALVDALEDDDWWVRGRAADAVATRGGRVLIPAVLPMISRSAGDRRSELVTLIERLAGDKPPFDILATCLGRSDTEVSRGAVRALGELGEVRATESLIALLGKDTERRLDTDILAALTKLADPRAVAPLLERLEVADDEARSQIIETLGAVTDSEQVSLVVERISRATQRRASDALERLVDRTLESLRARLGDLGMPAAAAAPGGVPAPSPAAPESDDSQPTLVTHVTGKPAHRDTIIDSAASQASWVDVNPLAFKPGQRLGDRYRVIRQVGRGGFGVVVLAEDEIVGEQLILKFLAPHLAQDTTAIERFKHEIRYARRITHENVIRIYDLIALEGVFAIAMEFFQSHSLSAELRHEPRLPVVHGLGILRQVCRGLTEAHRVEVIHRDLKPGNILIGAGEHVKIVDFGLAAAATHGASRLTRSGLLLGTPTYMAPEQIEGRDLDHRADIYSLGVLMYEVFTGRVPFEGANAIATLFQHLDAQVVAPRAVVPSLPEGLETVILKAMARAPEARYATAEQLTAELDRLYAEVAA